MLVVAALAVAGFGVPLAFSVQARYRDEALLTLSEEAAKAVVSVPGSFAKGNDRPELPDPADQVNLALYDVDGRKLQGEGPIRADAVVAAALHGGSTQRDRAALVVAFPISHQESVVGAIRTSLPVNVVADRVHRTWAAMAALAFGVLVAASLLAAQRSRSLTRPLAELRSDADLIGNGGQIRSRPGTGIVEIDAVQSALVAATAARDESLERERSLSADLAHQLSTPLASLRLHIEADEADGGDPQRAGGLLRDVDRLQRTIDDVLTLARDDARVREPHPLATMVRAAAADWETRLVAAGRRFEVDLEPHLPWVDASSAAIRQILDVLLDNALNHGEGTVRLSGARIGPGAVVAVADHGRVIVNPDTIFVRRGPDASGTGIGLALARRLAEAEDLRLILDNPGPGVVVHLVFGARLVAQTPRIGLGRTPRHA